MEKRIITTKTKKKEIITITTIRKKNIIINIQDTKITDQ